MDLVGVCLTVDALHSLVGLNERVLARGGHVIFVIKGTEATHNIRDVDAPVDARWIPPARLAVKAGYLHDPHLASTAAIA